MALGLRDRPAAVRQVRRRAGAACARPLPARVHSRRRLPYPQPESRAGHERLHAGWLQSGMETGVGLTRTILAKNPAYLFGRTPRHRQGTDRLRSQVGQDVQRSAEGSLQGRQRRRRSRGVARILRQTGALHGGYGNPVLPVDHFRRADLSASRERPRSRHALSFGAGHPSGRRQAGSAGSHGQGGRPLAAVCLRRRGRPRCPVL